MATNEETLKINVRLADFASAQFGKLNQTVRGFGTGAVGAFRGVTGAVSSLQGALGGLGIALSVRGLVDLVKATANEADELRDLSIQLGTTTEFLSELKFAGSQAGVEIGELEVGIRTLGKNLGEVAATGKGQALPALKQLDETTQRLLTSTAPLSEKFLAAARAIRALPESERLFVASKLFGRGGGSLLQLFAEDLDAASKKARELGVSISGEAADAADAFNDSIGELTATFKGFRNQVILPLLPELKGLIEGFTGLSVSVRDVVSAANLGLKLKGGLLGAIGLDAQEKIESAERSVRNLQATIEFGRKKGFDPWAPEKELIERLKEAEKRLESLQGKFEETQKPFAGDTTKRGEAIRADLAPNKVKDLAAIQGQLEAINREIAEGQARLDSAVFGRITGAIKERAATAVQASKDFVIAGLAELRSLEERRLAVAALNDEERKRAEEEKERSAAVLREQKLIGMAFVEQTQVLVGLRGAFADLTTESQKYGTAARDAVMGVSDAIGFGATDAVLELVEGQKKLKEASRDAAKQILSDIARIIVQTVILRTVQGSLGGIGTGVVSLFEKGGITPGPLVPVRGLSRGDVISPPGGLFRVGEGRTREAVIPMPDNRSVPVKFVGEGARQGGAQPLTVVVNYNGTLIGEKALFQRNAEQIQQAVAQKVAVSATYREQISTRAA